MGKKLKHLTFKVFYYEGEEYKEGMDQIWIQPSWFKKDEVVKVQTHDNLIYTWETGINSANPSGKCGFHPIEALLRWWWRR